MAARVQPTPHELATAHLDGQRQLRADAARLLERAATARADAERAHGAATTAHAQATAASSARPDDEKALDAMARAATKLQRERTTLGAKVQAHEEAKREHAAFEGHVAGAERALELATLERDIADPSVGEALAETMASMVGRVHALVGDVARYQALLRVDHERVARARELGSHVQPRDGLAGAAGFARALLKLGGSLRYRANDVRWACDLLPVASEAPRIDKAISSIVTLVLQAIREGTSLRDPHAELPRLIPIWERCRNSGELQAIEEAERHRQPEPAHAVDARARLDAIPRTAPANRLGPRLMGSR